MTGSPSTAAGLRCAAHPARPAVDSCPTCGRARCGADATGPGCAVCSAQHAARGRPPTRLELLLRAVLASYAAALLAGWVNSQYVGSDFFAYVAPAVAGVATAAGATSAAPGRDVLRPVRGIGVALGVAAVAFGLVLEGTYDALDLRAEVLVPYALAGLAAWLWTAPPRRRRVKASSAG